MAQNKKSGTLNATVPEKPSSATVLNVWLGTLAPSGRRSMRSLLALSAGILQKHATVSSHDWATLRYADVAAVRAALSGQGYAITTINMTLAALKGVAQTAFNLGQMDAESLTRIRSVKGLRGERAPAGRALSRDEIRLLMDATKQHVHKSRQKRDRAILLTLCGAGLRAGELVAPNRQDYDIPTRTLTVRQGKGRKHRSIVVSPAVGKALASWLKISDSNRFLFCRIHRSGNITGLPLTPSGLTGILRHLQITAQVSTFPPHDLRRTFITRLLEQGADINIVRQLAGHRDISTTAIYDRRSALSLSRVSSSVRF